MPLKMFSGLLQATLAQTQCTNIWRGAYVFAFTAAEANAFCTDFSRRNSQG
jgi:hypothetical protein